MRRLLLMLSFVALAAAGSAGAVVGGAPDGTAHPYVGLVSNGYSSCSGSLVSPTVFVTAAHCFSGQQSKYGGSTVHLTFAPLGAHDPNLVILTGTFTADPAYCNACGNGLPGFQTHDVGVVVLDEPQPGPYAQLPSQGLVDRLAQGTAVQLVGYGATDVTSKSQPVGFGTRNAGSSTLIQSNDRVSGEFLKLNPTAFCLGDSGGPVLLGDTVLGVDSFLTNDKCNGVGYAERLDTAAELAFVRSFFA